MPKLSITFAVLATATSWVSAQGIPELVGEPGNDAIAGAETAHCNAQHYGNLDASGGDNDLWRFSLADARHVAVWTSQRGTAPVHDTIVDILDSVGAVLASNDDELGAPGLMSLASIDLGPGTYYVNVRGFGGAANGDYAFDLLCEGAPGTLADAAREVEPNDACAAATLSTCWQLHRNTLQVAGDSDFYKLAVASETTVTWETHSDSSTTGSAIADTKLWLYDIDCAPLAEDDDGGAGLFSRLTITLARGTYFLEVSDPLRGAAGDYALRITCVGGDAHSAQVLTTLAVLPADPCAETRVEGPEETEPNDACAEAEASACCEEYANGLDAPGDSDFYALTLDAETTVTWEILESTVTTGTAADDTSIWLYDAACLQIAEDDDSGTGLLSKLTRTLPAGTYYLEVSDWQRNGIGDYLLRIDCSAPDLGCVGTGGNPIRLAPRIGERPRLGSTCTTDVFDMPPASVMFIGTSAIEPVELGVIGMPSCALGIVVNIDKLPIRAVGGGHGEFSIRLGFIPGLTFYMQAAGIDVGANALGVVLSRERLEWTIGNEVL